MPPFIAWMTANPHAEQTVEILAARVSMSVRQFSRAFSDWMGQTPARCVGRLCLAGAPDINRTEGLATSLIESLCSGAAIRRSAGVVSLFGRSPQRQRHTVGAEGRGPCPR
jgi:transcriptional regulator GlxA family with amidase domain